MLYPKVTTKEWIEKYPSLKVKSKTCKNCRKGKVHTTEPCMSKNWVGLIAPKCESCGWLSGFSVFIARNPSFNLFLDEVAAQAIQSDTTVKKPNLRIINGKEIK
jgi:hypothetical protein